MASLGGPPLLIAAAGLWAGGACAFSVAGGYVLAPLVHGHRRSPRVAACEDAEPPAQIELIRPPEAGALLTESQARRLAPVNNLKRKRRSRKIRTKTVSEDKFVPLVPGARQSTSESIIAAYNSDELEVQQLQGEDYWVDPSLLNAEIKEKQKVSERRKKFTRKKGAFSADRLKQEVAAPYKNNVIGAVVLGFGVVAAAYVLFPGAFEYKLDLSIASFPDSL